MEAGKKTVLVTGGAKGIGRQVCLTMAEEGYNVIANYRTDEDAARTLQRQIEEMGRRCEIIYGDMSVIEDIRTMYQKAYEAFDTIDVVVNNAGISSEVYFLDATEEMFDHMTAVDWKGVFFSSQIAAKEMMKRKTEGVIINVSSNQVDGCWPRATIYAPTKAAVTKFTKNAAMELAGTGVRMVAIAPGYTDVGWEPGDIRLEAAQRLPLRRFASTKEIARGVVYLASEDAAYMLGSTLTIDGGATLPVVAANDFV
ncbi:MAG: SDR family NAD(P)-dependent oxidoreductase [Lachnospiraceae bacterium]